jgi:c-di-GMP-binding flagellar brake protein YcgR
LNDNRYSIHQTRKALMARKSKSNSSFSFLLFGIAAGAALMYFMDPVQGRRRRALVQAKAQNLNSQTRQAIDARTHGVGNRALGLRVKASRMLH